MKNPISFCGLDCSFCPAYVATQANDPAGLEATAEKWAGELGLPIKPEDCVCDGCQPEKDARLGGYCLECPLRACGIKNRYPNCAYCPEYACEDLRKFFRSAPGTKVYLDGIRAGINKD